MLKTKKIAGLIALASVLFSGIAFASPGCGDAACDAPIPQPEVETPAEQGISISGGFSKLWKQTGIYRFIHPKTAEEKKAEKLNAAIKTAEAEISAGHLDKVENYARMAAELGADQATLERLYNTYTEKLNAGDVEHEGLLPEGLGQFVMIVVGLCLIYLAIAKKFEPLLLLPIGFGAILANIPAAGIAAAGIPGQPAGFLYYFYTVGVQSGVFPLLIFMGVGAMTDFGPLLANPKTALLGAAAQFGIFIALLRRRTVRHLHRPARRTLHGRTLLPARRRLHRNHRRSRRPNRHLPLLAPLPQSARCHRRRRLFLHGTRSDHSAAHHATTDHQSRTRH